MLEIRNRTPYQVVLAPGLDHDGHDFATVAIKATFALAASPDSDQQLPLDEEQLPLTFADEYYGEPNSSSIKYASEIGPAKGGTDVVLVGRAYAPGGRAQAVDVTLEAGPLVKTVRVFGDRQWEDKVTGLRISQPEPFEEIPLVYERAFGGTDTTNPDPSRHSWAQNNPVGTGYSNDAKAKHLDGLRLPNLEDPMQLLREATDKPPLAGFGYIAPHWEPRRSLAGTYDEAWQRERCPLLPLDFDNRHFRSAHPDLCSPTHFDGGEQVRIRNASPSGEFAFRIPGVRFEVKTSLKDEEGFIEPALDTLLIEPDQQRVAAIWKATLPCTRKFLLIDYVRVRELERWA